MSNLFFTMIIHASCKKPGLFKTIVEQVGHINKNLLICNNDIKNFITRHINNNTSGYRQQLKVFLQRYVYLFESLQNHIQRVLFSVPQGQVLRGTNFTTDIHIAPILRINGTFLLRLHGMRWNKLTLTFSFTVNCIYKGAGKSLARPASQCIFFMMIIFLLMLILLYMLSSKIENAH